MKSLVPPPPADFREFVERLRNPSTALHALTCSGFEPQLPIYVARAPGRLDVMGGIADYSGSLVLQMPIAEAAIAAVQKTREPEVRIISLPASATEPIREFALAAEPWSNLLQAEYEITRQMLAVDRDAHWAAYVIGPILVLRRERAARFDGGLRVLIDSRVPEGKGVSSSAAVEVATMRAFAAALGQNIAGEEIARLCQIAENRVVGAPCGIMDQMTSAVGKEGELLALRCQPAIVEGFVPIPESISFWGIDSGIRHAVTGSDYASVRIGAFMGYRIIADAAGLACSADEQHADGRVSITDPTWQGYLANVSPTEFRQRFADVVPEQICGHEFLARFSGTTDAVTWVDPERTYAVRRPTLHPIEEHERVQRFRKLLADPIGEPALCEMGELMTASHESYSACGLGCDETDLIVRLVRERGFGRGLYGAKITGGGSGGTVAVLGRSDASAVVEEITEEYSRRTGRETYIFRDSSPGACAVDVVQMAVEKE